MRSPKSESDTHSPLPIHHMDLDLTPQRRSQTGPKEQEKNRLLNEISHRWLKGISENEIHKQKLATEASAEELQVRQIELDLEKILLTNKMLELNQFAQNLNTYVEYLNHQKKEVMKISQQLAEELQVLKTIHPLKDYLKATELELTKVELDLKKTPSSSLNRPKVESYLENLFQQRNFLNSLIEASERQMNEQAHSILKIIQSDTLMALPPAPPLLHKKSEIPA